MTVRLRKPEKRECETCGRRERWDDEVGSWVLERVDGEPQAGRVFCLHEWNINGSFVPIDK